MATARSRRCGSVTLSERDRARRGPYAGSATGLSIRVIIRNRTRCVRFASPWGHLARGFRTARCSYQGITAFAFMVWILARRSLFRPGCWRTATVSRTSIWGRSRTGMLNSTDTTSSWLRGFRSSPILMREPAKISTATMARCDCTRIFHPRPTPGYGRPPVAYDWYRRVRYWKPRAARSGRTLPERRTFTPTVIAVVNKAVARLEAVPPPRLAEVTCDPGARFAPPKPGRRRRGGPQARSAQNRCAAVLRLKNPDAPPRRRPHPHAGKARPRDAPRSPGR